MNERIVWITDPHLNFLSSDQIAEYFDRVEATRPSGILLGGDFGEAPDCLLRLTAMESRWRIPLYFVLGNHDFYGGSIDAVREAIADACASRPGLVHLNRSPPIALSNRVGLIGHDGWADARVGDYPRSMVMMNDYRLIAELAAHSKAERWPVLRRLGDEAADHAKEVLPQALARFETVFFLTHAPPFREACWHEGGHSDDEWSPHFVCHALGEALLEVMADHANRKLIVLCGHTHSPGEYRAASNVLVLTAGAKYGSPGIAGVFEIPQP
jgi:Icc protein